MYLINSDDIVMWNLDLNNVSVMIKLRFYYYLVELMLI
jgi:hypothetical protein